MAEEIIEETPKESFWDKLKIRSPKKIFYISLAVFLLVLFALGITLWEGSPFRPKKVNAAEIIKKSLEKILEKGTIYHHKALHYRLSLEPNQPDPTPTTYEIWEDQDSDRFKQEVIYPDGEKLIQVFDGDVRWDYNEEENTLRKDIYIYPDPKEKEIKHGERLDLVRVYRELLDEGVLKSYEGELEGRKVWHIIDERQDGMSPYWNTFYFDKETFMLLQQERWEEKEGRKMRTEKMTYEIMESISKKDLDIVGFFAFDYSLPEGTVVLERHFDFSSGYVESDYYSATTPGILTPAELHFLDQAAMELKDKGRFSVEFGPRGLELLIRRMVEELGDELKNRAGVEVNIVDLEVEIKNEQVQVAAKIQARQQSGFIWSPWIDIKTQFRFQNIPHKPDRIQTTHLEVEPEKIFGLVDARAMIEPVIEGEKINDAFRGLLSSQLQAKGASFDYMMLRIAPEDKLRVELKR